MRTVLALVIMLGFTLGSAHANGDEGPRRPRNIRNNNTNTAIGVGIGVGKAKSSSRSSASSSSRSSAKQYQGQEQDQVQVQSQSAKLKQLGIVVTKPHQDVQVPVTLQDNSEIVAAAAPNVSAPGLTTGHDTCMGSTSGGAGAQVGLIGAGLTVGTTWTDIDCNRRKYAMLLRHFGHEEAALLLLAQNEEVGKALLASGTVDRLPVLSNLEMNIITTDEEGNVIETKPASRSTGGGNRYMDHIDEYSITE